MELTSALPYLFQGQGWMKRIIVLALVQLVPIIGQGILIGYGLEVVRAMSDGQAALPPIRWGQALKDGLLFMVVGIAYCLPILLMIPMLLASGVQSENAGGIDPAIFPVIMIVLLVPLQLVVKRVPKLKPLVTLFGGLMMLGIVGMGVSQLGAVKDTLASGSISLSTLGSIQLVFLMVLALVILIGYQVVGVRYAITGKGLLAPTETIKLMARHRDQTMRLMLHVLLLGLIAAIMISIGLVLLVLPGLCLIVVFSLVQWQRFTQYGMAIGLNGKVADPAS